MFEIGRRLPLLWPVLLFALPANIKKKFDLFLEYSRDLVRARVARKDTVTREDFFARLLADKSENKSEEWLMAQANVLVIAGSDTTATALATITYYLAANQDKLWHLQQEIRRTFEDSSSITSDSLQGLPYLNAIIEEGLRICPPTSFGLPRISPGALVDGHMVPAGVSSISIPDLYMRGIVLTSRQPDNGVDCVLDHRPPRGLLPQCTGLSSGTLARYHAATSRCPIQGR